MANRLLWPLWPGPDVPTLSGVHCKRLFQLALMDGTLTKKPTESATDWVQIERSTKKPDIFASKEDRISLNQNQCKKKTILFELQKSSKLSIISGLVCTEEMTMSLLMRALEKFVPIMLVQKFGSL